MRFELFCEASSAAVIGLKRTLMVVWKVDYNSYDESNQGQFDESDAEGVKKLDWAINGCQKGKFFIAAYIR